MRILFFEPSMFQEHRGELLDEALRLANEGHEVIFLYNSCCLDGLCSLNMNADTLRCTMCKRHVRDSLKLLTKNVKQVNIEKFWQPVEQISFEYKNVFDLKKIEYKGVKVGYAVLSTYINGTRNLYPKIDVKSKPYFDRLLSNACHLTDAIERAILEYKPERLCFFNARMLEWRPPYELALQHHIEAYCYEVVGGWGEPFSKIIFVNSTPHGVESEYERYTALWNKVNMSDNDKIKLAKSFFEKRRNAIPAGDRVYVAGQEKGKLPSDWDDAMKNIVIFNSSEDEFAAVGAEYDSYALFPSQYRGLRFILDKTKDMKDVHVYLRIHPNLQWIKYRYHTELLKLQELYSHLTVIPAGDKISSYALMDGADKVIVFGSTMGLESAYWGKPVILLAGSSYYMTNLCYIPHTEAELVEMLKKDLQPRDNHDALLLGFDYMYRDPNNGYKYLDFNFTDFGWGKYHWHVVKYLKLLGSYKLYYFYNLIVKQFYKKNRKSIVVPREEDLSIEL